MLCREARAHLQSAPLPPCPTCSLIFLSELGDKTFFIAALLAMRCGKWISFIGSTAALAAMTVSAGMQASCLPGSGQLPYTAC